MAIEHSVATDPDLHEPKGVAGASAGTVYTANGAGSGVWSAPLPPIHVHGSIYTIPTDSHTVAATTTPVKGDLFINNGTFNGMSVDATNDELTVPADGNYSIAMHYTIGTNSPASANTISLVVRRNGAVTHIGVDRYLSGSSDTGAMGVTDSISLSAGDVISVWINSTGNYTYDMFRAALFIHNL